MVLLQASISEGLDPRERIARFKSCCGSIEETTVGISQAHAGAIEVYVIHQVGGQILIELSRETSRGHWRVWVDEGCVECLR